MRFAALLVLCLVVSGLLFDATSARADDAPIMIMGGSASPKSSHKTIRMDSEDVTIRLGKASYTVDALFHFFNTGETTAEWVGFPKQGSGNSDESESVSDFIRFDTWVDGQKVRFSGEDQASTDTSDSASQSGDSAKESRWLVKDVTFPGHQSTTTRVSYEAAYTGPGGAAYYIYGTGSYWKDSIRRATFTIDGSAVGVRGENLRVNFFFPDTVAHVIRRRLLTDSVVAYEITDFKPRRDGVLSVYVPGDRY